MTATVYTAIIETTVYGVRAYHWECSCGMSGRRVNRERDALKSAQTHTVRIHGAQATNREDG